MAKTSIVVARERFLAEIDGETFDVVAGDLFEADHPLPRKHPQLFNEPVFKFPVKEQKAAEPTERKGLTTASLRK